MYRFVRLLTILCFLFSSQVTLAKWEIYTKQVEIVHTFESIQLSGWGGQEGALGMVGGSYIEGEMSRLLNEDLIEKIGSQDSGLWQLPLRTIETEVEELSRWQEERDGFFGSKVTNEFGKFLGKATMMATYFTNGTAPEALSGWSKQVVPEDLDMILYAKERSSSSSEQRVALAKVSVPSKDVLNGLFSEGYEAKKLSVAGWEGVPRLYRTRLMVLASKYIKANKMADSGLAGYDYYLALAAPTANQMGEMVLAGGGDAVGGILSGISGAFADQDFYVSMGIGVPGFFHKLENSFFELANVCSKAIR